MSDPEPIPTPDPTPAPAPTAWPTPSQAVPDPEPDPTPEPVPTPDPENPPAPTPEGDPVPTPDPADDSSVPEALRPLVTGLRQESAARRTELKPFKEAFDGYQPAEVEGFLSLAKGLSSDDPAVQVQVAQRLVDIAQQITDANPDVNPTEDPSQKPLTVADYEAREQERVQKQEADRQIAAVRDEVKTLGYEENTPDFRLLMDFALDQPDGDLAKADAAVKQYKQGIIDAAVKELREKGKAFPKTPLTPGGGITPPPEGEIKDWKDARAATDAYLRAPTP